ncbi:MAG: alpha/beta fold hydrolase [Syntrophomonadaceae bacterium]
MPVIESSFKPSWAFRNAHIQTVFPTLFRKIIDVNYTRQRITTTDGDFIDLDWSYAPDQKKVDSLAVLCHGLEGCSERAYMAGMARAFNRRGIDVVSYNYRGCSGESNLEKRYYTAGATDDLEDVLNSIKTKGGYNSLYLVGFSLGANLVLKYAGENGAGIKPDIKGVAAVSAPCDLRSSSIELDKLKNRLYSKRFLKMLCDKVKEKIPRYPELGEIALDSLKTLKEFDNLVTAPLSGFIDAEDYWHRASCLRVLQDTAVPTLIINAADDPILGPECYPWEEARSNNNIFLEVPKWGGHVGFMPKVDSDEYWHEQRVAEFMLNLASV